MQKSLVYFVQILHYVHFISRKQTKKKSMAPPVGRQLSLTQDWVKGICLSLSSQNLFTGNHFKTSSQWQYACFCVQMGTLCIDMKSQFSGDGNEMLWSSCSTLNGKKDAKTSWNADILVRSDYLLRQQIHYLKDVESRQHTVQFILPLHALFSPLHVQHLSQTHILHIHMCTGEHACKWCDHSKHFATVTCIYLVPLCKNIH